mmetsp:Transcript_8826/g.14554  ORF Transcript_8826/g.14554 Transcript_8826/m.14554 type:complete len:255 (-) Transcript_8826:554-1318(-)
MCMSLPISRGFDCDHFHHVRNQLEAERVIPLQIGIGALSILRHPSNNSDGSHVIIPTLESPRGDGGVMHGAAQSKVRFDIVLKNINSRTGLSADPSLRLWDVVNDIIQHNIPVARWSYRIGPIGPKFGQDPGIITSRHFLFRIWVASDWVAVVSASNITTMQSVVEPQVVVIVGDLLHRGDRCIAHRGRTYVDHRTIGRVHVAGPVQDLLETLEELELFLPRRSGFFIGIQIDHRRWTRIDVGDIFVARLVIIE